MEYNYKVKIINFENLETIFDMKWENHVLGFDWNFKSEKLLYFQGFDA
jgi:hypothetical protein